MEKQANTPMLRFSEFGQEWKKIQLMKLMDFKVTNSFSRENLNYENGKIKNIHYGDIHTKFNTLFDITKEDVPFINHDMNTARIIEDFFCKEGDMVFADASEDLNDVGKSMEIVNLNNEKLLSGLHTLLARPKKGKFFIGFTGYLFKSSSIRRQIKKEAQGSKVLSINVGRLSNIEISFPSLPEQQKIATFLTSVDEKLQALKKKENLLEAYKKGVMQKLFSQEYRFTDEKGEAFPEWEMKTLREIGETYGGLSGKTKENFGFGKPYIQYKQIFDNSKIDISRFELVDISENEKQNKVKFGDVFFTISSETPEEIGMSSVLLDEIEDLYLNSFCFGYRANSKTELSPFYSKYLFRSELMRVEIIKLAQGSTRYNMSKNQMLKIVVQLPCLKEQTKIANFLSSIDEKISLTQIEIHKMEAWKKGLLQKMFV